MSEFGRLVPEFLEAFDLHTEFDRRSVQQMTEGVHPLENARFVQETHQWYNQKYDKHPEQRARVESYLSQLRAVDPAHADALAAIAMHCKKHHMFNMRSNTDVGLDPGSVGGSPASAATLSPALSRTSAFDRASHARLASPVLRRRASEMNNEHTPQRVDGSVTPSAMTATNRLFQSRAASPLGIDRAPLAAAGGSRAPPTARSRSQHPIVTGQGIQNEKPSPVPPSSRPRVASSHPISVAPITQPTFETAHNTNGLVGRCKAGERNVLSEASLLPDLSSALIGVEGSFFRLGTDFKLHISDCVCVSFVTRQRVEWLMRVANRFLELQRPAHGVDRIANACYASMDRLLCQYYETVARLTNVDEVKRDVLMFVCDGLSQWADKLELLCDLKTRFAQQRGIRMLAMANQAMNCYVMGSAQYRAASELVGGMMFVLCDMIKTWLAEGAINEADGEWFITVNCAVSEGDWLNRHSLHNEAVPSLFIFNRVPERMFHLGKSISLLPPNSRIRDECAAVIQQMHPDLFDYQRSGVEVHRVLDRLERLCEGAVLETVLQREKLLPLLRLLREVLFFHDGRFSSNVTALILSDVSAVRSRLGGFSMEAATKCLATAISEHLQSVQKEGTERKKRGRAPVDFTLSKRSSVRDWWCSLDRLQPLIRTERVTALLFHPSAMASYTRLFHRLSTLHLISGAVWRTAVSAKQHNEWAWLHPGAGRLVRMCTLLLNLCRAAVDKMRRFCNEEMAACAGRLSARISRASFLNEVIIAHDEYLKELLERLLLTDSKASSCFATVLERIIEAHTLAQKLHGECAEETRRRREAQARMNDAVAASETVAEFEGVEESVTRQTAADKMNEMRAPIKLTEEKLVVSIRSLEAAVHGEVKSFPRILIAARE